MADVKIEVVRFTTTDVGVGDVQTILATPGFGVPVAAIFLSQVQSVADGVVAPGVFRSIGVFDGTNQACSGTRNRDDRSTTDAYYRQDTDDYIISIVSASGTQSTAYSAVGFVADGVQIRAEVSPSARGTAVILIGGADAVNAAAGVFNTSAGTSPQAITTGFEPSLVFTFGCGPGGSLGNINTHHIGSFGCAINDGGSTQKATLFSSTEDVSTTIVNSYASSSRGWGRVLSDTLTWLVTIGGWNATGFTMTMDTSFSGIWFPYLAVEFANDPDIALVDATIPTVGNYTEVFGFEPSFGLLSTIIGPAARDVLVDTQTYVESICAFDASSIVTINGYERDAAGNSDNARMTDGALTILDYVLDGASNAVESSGYSLNSTGWDFTLTTNPGAPILGWALAIGPGGAPPVSSLLKVGANDVDDLKFGSIEVDAAYLGTTQVWP